MGIEMVRTRRRRFAFVAAVVVLSAMTAACGGDGGGDAASSTSSTSTTTTSSSVDAGATTTPRPDGAGGTGPTSPTTRRGATTTTARTRTSSPSAAAPDAGATAPGGGDVQPTAGDDGSQGAPGAFARTLLRPQPATSIVLDRFAQQGAALGAAAVDHSARVVGDVSGKRVDVRPVAALGSASTSWTADDLRAAADAAATVAQGSQGRAVVRLLVVRGSFEGNDQVLGVTVRGDVIAVFADQVAAAATPIVSRAAIEDAVLLHELGHVLGLVDLARDTKRADKDHPGHSANPGSVMYWAVESSLVGQVLNGPPPHDFDRDDLADLAALRNGA